MAAPPGRFAIVDVELKRARREESRRTYPERLHRQVSAAIDHGCDCVERVRLAGGRRCPVAMADLVAELRDLAGEDRRQRPRSCQEAHEELFRLATVLLGRPAEVER